MSMNILNDISKVYLEQIAESAVPGKPAEKVGALTNIDIPKSEQEAARKRTLEKAAKARAKRNKITESHFKVGDEVICKASGMEGEVVKVDPEEKGKYYTVKREDGKKVKYAPDELKLEDETEEMEESLDPVGQEDADIDNDGKKNTKSDKYLLKRRKAISKAMKEAVHSTAKQMHSPHEVPSGNLKGLVKKAVKRIDTDVDGDTDKNDKAKGELGEFIPGVGNKRLYSTTRTTTAKESFSNWRNDLREITGEVEEYEKQIKEKIVKNKININPKISEEVTILEMVEISEEQEIETLSHAVDFFFEEGINEDGLEMIIEDLGLEGFVDLVYEIGYETLTEARTLLGKKKNPQKLPKGTAPAKTTKAAVAKYGTTRKFKSSSASGILKKKPAAAKAVETAKQEQPKKKPVRDAIARGIFRAVDAYKAGMERHRQATAGMGKAAKETGKTIAKAAKVTHEAGRRAGESSVGQAVKKAGAAAIKAGVEKAKRDIKSLKKEELELHEKSVSVSQQQAAGAALAAKRGEIKPSELQGASLQMYKSMTEKELRDFAKTKHKGLPEKKEVKEAVASPENDANKTQQMKKQQLAKQQEMLKKLQMLQRQRLQMQKQGRLPIGSTMEETEVIGEKTRYAKETGVNFRKQKPQPEGGSAKNDKAFQQVSKLMRTMSGGRPSGQRPKVKGKKPPEAGKYGSERESPAQIVAKRRAAAQRAKEFMSDTRGT